MTKRQLVIKKIPHETSEGDFKAKMRVMIDIKSSAEFSRMLCIFYVKVFGSNEQRNGPLSTVWWR